LLFKETYILVSFAYLYLDFKITCTWAFRGVYKD